MHGKHFLSYFLIFTLILLFFDFLPSNASADSDGFDIISYSDDGYVSTGVFSGYEKISVKWAPASSDPSIIDHYEVWVNDKGWWGMFSSDTKVATLSNSTHSYVYHNDKGDGLLYIKVVYVNGVTEVTSHYLDMHKKSPLSDSGYTLHLSRTGNNPVLGAIWDMLSNFFGKLINGLAELPLHIFTWMMNASSGALNFLSNLFTGLVDGISSKFGIAAPIAAAAITMGMLIGVLMVIKLILYVI